uniref:DNA topoisomerase n=1 Tax=Virus NIOZ-UU159 TaxID=2763270 RepID=A0A7S9SVD3_9VIRU|nr:MAG: DNA topoisomerase I, catalytic core [Virus NIOZ-UU159]|tara:strand:- start:1146 stop:2000 length:855 start_codon:yes stop_codon:yes gene_type:complete
MKVQRIGTYKKEFKYFNKNNEIKNEKQLDFFKSLKIPPAYNNVTITNGKKIIAYGYDSKNRKQVIYNPNFISKQNSAKFKKIKDSIKYFSRLKREIKKDISSNSINKICAIIITLILDCGFRIGNKKYEINNNSYGLTTLKKEHIFIENNFIKIDFIGKKKVRNTAICKSKDIYNFFFDRLDNIRDEEYIFKYNDKCITSNDVNKYLYNFYKKFNLKITTKDLRTLNANTLFMKFFKLNINSENPIKKSIEDTAIKLHNTYAVCKKNYIDPEIIKMAESQLNKK